MPIPWDVAAACAGLCSGQLYAALRFLLQARRQARPDSSRAGAALFPPATVVVPCAGRLPGLEDNVRALLAQDYPGEAEFLFVCPSKRDPAYLALVPLSGLRKDGRCLLLDSGLSPSRCSGKAADLLFALERARPGSELLVFADSDLRVRPDWLRRMALALADPAVSLATSMSLPLAAEGAGAAALLRCAWQANGIPYLAWLGIPCGQSLAMRRRDLESMDVARLWGKSLLEDLALYAAHGGGRTAFVCGAMSHSAQACGLKEFLAQNRRWMLGFRVYAPWVWTLGALTTFAKLWLYLWALRRSFPGVAFFLAASDLLAARLLARAYALCLEGASPSWRASLCAPLLPVVYAADFLGSLLGRDLRWGAYEYRLEGPARVVALPTALQAPLRDNERLLRWLGELFPEEGGAALERLRAEEARPGTLVGREIEAAGSGGARREGVERLRRESPALLYQGIVAARSRRGVSRRSWLMREAARGGVPLKVLCVEEGPGFHSLCLARLGHEVSTLELSRPCLRFASRLLREHGAEVRILGEASSLPEAAFDLIAHLGPPELFSEAELDGLKASLKPGGRLLVFSRLFPPPSPLRVSCEGAANALLLRLWGVSPLADPDTRAF